jgi:DNA-binding NarL/FixJ family response regulator
MSALATGLPSGALRASRTRLLIADDHPLILAGVRRTLERNDEIEIVGEATTGAQVLAMVERRRPDVVMLDPKMPGMIGAELVETIRRDWPEVRIVVLSANADTATIDSALLAGASAYVVKNVSPAELPGLIRQVSNGAIFHAPSRPVHPSGAADASGADELTQRERTILEAISTGKTTAAISRELWVSEHTIKFHLTNIYRKLGVSNRAGAIRHALEHHLVG